MRGMQLKEEIFAGQIAKILTIFHKVKDQQEPEAREMFQ